MLPLTKPTSHFFFFHFFFQTAGASQYGSTGVAPDGEHNEEMYAHQETRVYDETDDFTISTEEERGVEVEVDEPVEYTG